MALTPVEIRNLKFKKSVSGYDAQEVKKWLELIADELEKLIVQNQEYKERIKGYEELEDTLRATIEATKMAMERMREAAESERDAIIKSAKEEAQRLIEEARTKRAELEKEALMWQNIRDRFIAEFKALLLSYLEIIERHEKKAHEESPEDYTKISTHLLEKEEPEG